MSEWKKVKFLDVVSLNPRISLEKGVEYPFVEMSNAVSSIFGLNNISMPDGTVRKVVAKKTVDNCVDNLLEKEWKTIFHYSLREKQPVILQKNKSFPPFFAEKRYKLCKFAPSKQIVDKVTMCFIISR